MPRVIVLDSLSQAGLGILQSSEVIDHEVHVGLQGDQLRDALREFDGAICRSGAKITGDVLNGNRRLKVIVRAGTGTDNIEKETATRMGIVVVNIPDANTVSTAEHTITLMMALSRNIFPAYQSLIEGRWDRKLHMGSQVAGKTLGVIGMGRVGQAVAVRAQALGMRVLGYDPYLPPQRLRELGVTSCDTVDELLPEADYLTVHMPLHEETRHFIGAEQIQKMKKGVRFINCARGGIVDTDALVEGLKNGRLGGAAIDVYESEPCTDSPLFGMPNVLCTPHLAASTEEAQASAASEAAKSLIDFFTTGAIKSPVNFSPLDPVVLADLRGFLNVAYRLGLLLSQICDSPPTRCKLHYEGEVTKKNYRSLSAAFAAGLLEHAIDLEVNIVNAELLLRERGIGLEEQLRSHIGDFRSLIKAEVEYDGGSMTVGGTLLGQRIPGLMQIGDSRLECRLEGILLMTTHSDTPGVIGKIGRVCGNHQVNIAYMSIGRRPGEQSGTQVGVSLLDNEPPAEVIRELLALDSISNAKIIRMPAADAVPSWMGG